MISYKCRGDHIRQPAIESLVSEIRSNMSYEDMNNMRLLKQHVRLNVCFMIPSTDKLSRYVSSSPNMTYEYVGKLGKDCIRRLFKSFCKQFSR